MFELKIFYVSGILIPIIYFFLYILGGFLKSDYNHISNSVSELLSPGAPNKRLLTSIQLIYALLHIVFGYSVLCYIKDWENRYIIGQIGAWLIIALGLTTLGTVVFPQDAKGQSQTNADRIHKILVFFGLIPFSIFSTLFIGLWTNKAGFYVGFDIYSFITIGAIAFMGVVGGLTVKTRYSGLVERIAAFISQLWLGVLGLILFLY